MKTKQIVHRLASPVQARKEQLATDILMMMSASFDRWYPDNPDADQLVKAAHVMARAIAEKLDKASQQNSAMTESDWKKIVTDATRDASLKLPGSDQLLKLGRSRGFAEAVAECTAATVAPAGADWAHEVKTRREALLREALRSHGLNPQEVEDVMVGQKVEAFG